MCHVTHINESWVCVQHAGRCSSSGYSSSFRQSCVCCPSWHCKWNSLHPTPYTLHIAPCTLTICSSSSVVCLLPLMILWVKIPTPYVPHPTPHTLHPAPYTLHPYNLLVFVCRVFVAPHDTVGENSYTLHPAPYILHPTSYTLHLAPYRTLHPTPYTLHPTSSPPYRTLHSTPYILHPTTPYTLHPTPYTLNPYDLLVFVNGVFAAPQNTVLKIPAPYTRQPTPYTLHLAPYYTLHPAPYLLTTYLSFHHSRFCCFSQHCECVKELAPPIRPPLSLFAYMCSVYLFTSLSHSGIRRLRK